jgi:cAMP-dependent protein kinase regulator
MLTAGELKQAADESLFSEHFEQALRLYLQLLELQPLNLDARLRVGDALLALGEVQRAAVVYTRLAQYAAHAGYPLRALTALKILAALEPELGGLVHSIGELYARDSVRLGPGVRRSLPSAEELVPRTSQAPQDGLAQLVVEAEQLAVDYDHKDALLPERLMAIPLLSQLDQSGLSRVFDAMELSRLRPGTIVAAQGSEGGSLFVLARGSVAVNRSERDGKQRRLATLREGSIFGELSFLSRMPRSATIVAESDCDLLQLSVAALERMGEAGASLRAVVAAFARERLLGHVMANSPLFAPLEPVQRIDLIKRFVELDVPAGAAIVEQGHHGQGAYVVLRGEVSVSRSEGERTLELARLGPGELFGEMSLLSGEGATATVRAYEPTSVLLLARHYFDRLLDALPDMRAQLEQLADTRFRQIASSFAPRTPGDDDGIEIEVLL